MTDKTITITKEEYIRLRIESEELSRLEAGGVDNWQWYWESLNPDNEESMDQAMKRINKEIMGDGQ